MKIIHKTIFLLFLSIISLAQNQPIFRLTNTPKGIFVEIGKPEFVGREFELQRKTADGSFKKIATLDAPNRENQLKRRIDDAEKVFVQDARPTEKNIDETWKNFKDKNANLNKFVASVPQLELVFGLAYFDDEVKPNEKYQYQLVEKKNVLATSNPIIYAKYHSLPKLVMVEQSKQGADIVMDFKYPVEYQPYSKFIVRRKMFSQKASEYKPINPLISFSNKKKNVTLSIADTTLNNYSGFDYQIRVADIFGNLDSTSYYFNTNNIPPSLVPVPQNIKVSARKDRRSLDISWAMTNNQTIQSVKLYRSRNFDKDFKLIANLNANQTSLEDKIDIANEHYHYYFESFDLFGNKNTSIKFKGIYDQHTIPLKPTEIKTKKTSSGVEVSWKTSDLYTRGFYVFRKGGKDGDYVQISPLVPIKENLNRFTDTTKLMPETTYFYSVKAESDTYDKSGFSDIASYRIEANAKNFLKPPTDMNITFRDGKVLLTWENLNATIPQVLGYRVYRKGFDDKDYKLLTTKPLSFKQNFYEDSTFLSEGKYQFVVVSTDLGGGFSEKSLPTNLDLSNRFVMVPDYVGAELGATEIKLKWTGVEIDRIKSIKVYKAIENGDFKVVATIPKNKQDFADNQVEKGKTYVYKVSTIDLNNKESQTSDPVVVNF